VDCISYLIDLITPIVRNIPLVSMSATERANIAHVINVMATCSLSYVPSPTLSANTRNLALKQIKDYDGGESCLQLDPPLYELISFPVPTMATTPAMALLNKRPVKEHMNIGAYVDDELKLRHQDIPFEIRNILNVELKRFLITGKVSFWNYYFLF